MSEIRPKAKKGRRMDDLSRRDAVADALPDITPPGALKKAAPRNETIDEDEDDVE